MYCVGPRKSRLLVLSMIARATGTAAYRILTHHLSTGLPHEVSEPAPEM